MQLVWSYILVEQNTLFLQYINYGFGLYAVTFNNEQNLLVYTAINSLQLSNCKVVI